MRSIVNRQVYVLHWRRSDGIFLSLRHSVRAVMQRSGYKLIDSRTVNNTRCEQPPKQGFILAWQTPVGQPLMFK